MKIAIPSMDGASISPHFGRSRYFLVLGLEEGLINSRDLRLNLQAHGHSPEPNVPAEHHGHDHGAFAHLLMDCEAVLCGGIGMGARQALEAAGLQVCRVNSTASPEEAARDFALGHLRIHETGGCGCRCEH